MRGLTFLFDDGFVIERGQKRIPPLDFSLSGKTQRKREKGNRRGEIEEGDLKRPLLIGRSAEFCQFLVDSYNKVQLLFLFCMFLVV